MSLETIVEDFVVDSISEINTDYQMNENEAKFYFYKQILTFYLISTLSFYLSLHYGAIIVQVICWLFAPMNAALLINEIITLLKTKSYLKTYFACEGEMYDHVLVV